MDISDSIDANILDSELIAKAEIFSAVKDLALKIKALKTNHRRSYIELNEAIYEDIDLDLSDGLNVLYALYSQLKKPTG